MILLNILRVQECTKKNTHNTYWLYSIEMYKWNEAISNYITRNAYRLVAFTVNVTFPRIMRVSRFDVQALDQSRLQNSRFIREYERPMCHLLVSKRVTYRSPHICTYAACVRIPVREHDERMGGFALQFSRTVRCGVRECSNYLR